MHKDKGLFGRLDHLNSFEAGNSKIGLGHKIILKVQSLELRRSKGSDASLNVCQRPQRSKNIGDKKSFAEIKRNLRKLVFNRFK